MLSAQGFAIEGTPSAVAERAPALAHGMASRTIGRTPTGLSRPRGDPWSAAMSVPSALAPPLAALALTSRLPLPALPWDDALARRSAPWLPVAGAVIGLIVAACGHLAGALWAAPVAAALAVAVQVVLTGGLHEDGLADSADAVGVRGGRDAALAVMRDHHLGAFGALALALLLLVRTACYLAGGSSALAWIALGLAGQAGGRLAVLPVLVLPPARPDGLGATMANLPRRAWLVGMVLGMIVLAPLGWRGLVVVMAATLVGVGVAHRAGRWVGGATGDLAGAAAALGEVVALLAVCAGGMEWIATGGGWE